MAHCMTTTTATQIPSSLIEDANIRHGRRRRHKPEHKVAEKIVTVHGACISYTEAFVVDSVKPSEQKPSMELQVIEALNNRSGSNSAEIKGYISGESKMKIERCLVQMRVSDM
uniref:Uncharacterized protein n=1 Tax=Oryza sativa subsp. japonica TaxID=39947 RepID=Q6YXB2_ORYSJ|nr:hypothetical protein [Oryza sativa Japonica Group]